MEVSLAPKNREKVFENALCTWPIFEARMYLVRWYSAGSQYLTVPDKCAILDLTVGDKNVALLFALLCLTAAWPLTCNHTLRGAKLSMVK